MDQRCEDWLKRAFFDAFPGNQKEKYSILSYRHRLDFRQRTYANAWESLLSNYGVEHLVVDSALQPLDRAFC